MEVTTAEVPLDIGNVNLGRTDDRRILCRGLRDELEKHLSELNLSSHGNVAELKERLFDHITGFKSVDGPAASDDEEGAIPRNVPFPDLASYAVDQWVVCMQEVAEYRGWLPGVLQALAAMRAHPVHGNNFPLPTGHQDISKLVQCLSKNGVVDPSGPAPIRKRLVDCGVKLEVEVAPANFREYLLSLSPFVERASLAQLQHGVDGSKEQAVERRLNSPLIDGLFIKADFVQGYYNVTRSSLFGDQFTANGPRAAYVGKARLDTSFTCRPEPGCEVAVLSGETKPAPPQPRPMALHPDAEKLLWHMRYQLKAALQNWAPPDGSSHRVFGFLQDGVVFHLLMMSPFLEDLPPTGDNATATPTATLLTRTAKTKNFPRVSYGFVHEEVNVSRVEGLTRMILFLCSVYQHSSHLSNCEPIYVELPTTTFTPKRVPDTKQGGSSSPYLPPRNDPHTGSEEAAAGGGGAGGGGGGQNDCEAGNCNRCCDDDGPPCWSSAGGFCATAGDAACTAESDDPLTVECRGGLVVTLDPSKCLATGKQSTVYTFETDGGRTLVVKTSLHGSCETPLEVSVRSSWGVHPFIAPVVDWAFVPQLSRPFVTVMKRHGQDMPQSWQEAVAASACVLLAVEHVHRAGFMYGDLKPHNVCFDSLTGVAVLVDVEFSQRVNNPEYEPHTVGTPGFQPPEAKKGTCLGRPADVFGVGLVLAHHLLGRTHSWGFARQDAMSNVRALRASLLKRCHHSVPTEESRTYFSLLATMFHMLAESPDDRPSATDVLRTEPFASAAAKVARSIPTLDTTEKAPSTD